MITNRMIAGAAIPALVFIISLLIAYARQGSFAAIPLDASHAEWCRQQSAKVLAKALPNSPLAFDQNSMDAVSEYLSTGASASLLERNELMQQAGCFLGTAIIEKYGGAWVKDSKLGDGVEVVDVGIFYVMKKSRNQVESGDGQTIASLYESLPRIINTKLASKG